LFLSARSTSTIHCISTFGKHALVSFPDLLMEYSN
jgi:hypothetical protein